jgi:quinoprotein glucose dehydrogenase
MNIRHPLTILCLCIIFLAACKSSVNKEQYKTWEVVGGDKASTHYSALDQIDTSNVATLQPAWIFHTGDADTAAHSEIECNPIVVNGILYATSPKLKLIALDAATGKLKWSFDPFAENGSPNLSLNFSRGVSYWKDGNDQRIFFTAGDQLFAVNALTGKLIKNFGDSGKVNLHEGLGSAASNLFVVATSPGMIYQNLIIIGSRVSEGADAAPGFIHAFDVRTGKLTWVFHTIPEKGEPGYNTWLHDSLNHPTGGANNWCGMSLDEKTGIIYIPLGSASPDFFGSHRKGKDLYANCLLALNAATGKLIWYYQTIHHDMWDRDLPCAPTLLTVKQDGKTIQAVAQPTKTAFVFLFNRETGQPLFKINEEPVPTRHLPGEEPWPSQPVPEKPAPFVPHRFSANDINPYVSKQTQDTLLQQWKAMRSYQMFGAPDTIPQVVFPGFDGGAEWGGAATDPGTGMLYINANQIPWILKMIPTQATAKPATMKELGHQLFIANCAVCHGANRKGSGDFPSLINIGEKYKHDQLLQIIEHGRGRMNGFPQIKPEEKNAIIAFLMNQSGKLQSPSEEINTSDPSMNVPYTLAGYTKWRDGNGYPASKPPWGTLTAINLNNGTIKWQVPLGEYPALTAKGIPITGTENYGGPVVTAGGLIIIAATRDSKIRAFDKNTGKLLWQANLPYPGFATPATYLVNGKQYIVIACGGGKLETASGDAYVAFALPDGK